MEVQNLEQLFSLGSTEQQRRFWNVMQAQSVMRSNFGVQLVNKGDQITQHQYGFGGLADVYESMCLNLCGASHYPMTKLFGRSPAGMNSTGESDLQNYYDYINAQREAKLRPVLERLLPVLAMSVWGAVPENLSVDFPPLWTPTAKELADIAKSKAEAVVSVFQAGLLNVDTAQKELKKLVEETGMFGSISDEEIAQNAGKSYQDVTALRDPLMGLGYEEENPIPFEGAAQDAAVWDGRYIQLKNGQMNGSLPGGGKSGKVKKTKYAPSPRANQSRLTVSPKTFGILRGEFNTKFPDAKQGDQGSVSYRGRRYIFEADGSGSGVVVRSWKEK